MNGKYNECFKLCKEMTSRASDERPDCEEILKRKNSWALNDEEFEINDELKKDLNPKLDDENQIVFSLLKSKLNI